MRMNATLLLLTLSSLLLIQAHPRLRALQQGAATVVASNNTSSPYPGYTQIDTSNLGASWYNATVYNVFMYGVNGVVQGLVQQKKAPSSVYNVTNWVSAYYKSDSTYTTYKFYVTLANNQGVKIASNLTVRHNNRRNSNLLTSYNYRVTNIPTNSSNNNNSSSNNTSGYNNATPSQIHTDKILQGALQRGAQYVIQMLVNANKIPGTDLAYNMTKLNQAMYESQNNGTSYMFQTQNVNSDKVRVNANYTINYNNQDATYNVVSYSYNAFNYNISAVNVTQPSIPLGPGPVRIVTVDISAVIANKGTATSGALVNFNRPPRNL